MLSKKDGARLQELKEYWLSHHIMPVYREIMEITGLCRAGVSKFMHRLAKEGFIERHGHGWKPIIK